MLVLVQLATVDVSVIPTELPSAFCVSGKLAGPRKWLPIEDKTPLSPKR